MENEGSSSNTLNYAETAEQSKEYLRLVLQMLTQLKLSPNPVNYTLCYDYLSGHNKELRIVLTSIMSENQGLTHDAAQELFNLYIWNQDRRQLENSRAELRRVMSETLSGVDDSAQKASQSSDILGNCSEKLEANPDIQDLRNVVADVVMETKTMAQNGHLLQQMLTETKREVENLREDLELSRQQATTDALTGLLNRRAFDEEMLKLTEDANLSHESLSLLMIDIDHFKKINDSHGHLIGDKVIRFVGTQLSKNVKGSDIVARIGGEEYAILLPSTLLDHASIVSESIRKKIEASNLKRMDNNQPIGKVTISIGATNYRSGETNEKFLQRADDALYESKERGRNLVTSKS